MPAIETDLKRRAFAEDEIVLGVLHVVENDPSVTQRSVATELGIALGLANAYLKRCVRKGWIKVSQIPPRRYAYYVTSQGFAEKSRLTADYLSHSFSFFRRARGQCAEVFAQASSRGHRRFVLLGEGDLAEIASLVAHEFSVEIVGIVAVDHSANNLENDVRTLGQFDAVIVTTLVASREIFDAAVKIFGAPQVYAPDLLRVRRLASEAE